MAQSIEVENVGSQYDTAQGPVVAVKEVSFSVAHGAPQRGVRARDERRGGS